MRVAIYARKSTEDDRDPKNRSVQTQIDQATAYCEQKGWRVLRDHVYVDDGVSGAEFNRRPGFHRLLENLGKFDAVVMSEESRIGRESIYVGYYLKVILDSSVKVFYYLTDTEAHLDTPLETIVSQLGFFAAAQERQKAKERTRDALVRKARLGHVVGGKVYGYRNKEVQVRFGDSKRVRDHVEYEIDPKEAKVAQGIYAMFSEGFGYTQIAKTLNGIPRYRAELSRFFQGKTPPAPRKGPRAWSPSAINAILHRQKYAGIFIYGEYTNVDKQGTTRKRERQPEAKWEKMKRPELRIIPPDLWRAVQKRRKANQARSEPEAPRALALTSQPRPESPYLLSGLAQCGMCGASLVVIGGEYRMYGCSTHHNRGTCKNNLLQDVRLVDDAFAQSYTKVFWSSDDYPTLKETVKRVLRKFIKGMQRLPAQRDGLQRERDRLLRENKNFVQAIRHGKPPQSLLDAMRENETHITEIDADLAALDRVASVGRLDVRQVVQTIAQAWLAPWALLRKHPARWRQHLRKMLVDRVVFIPATLPGGKKTYKFFGEVNCLGLFAGFVEIKGFDMSPLKKDLWSPYITMASPTGFNAKI